jgi:hypothetical protein
MPIDTNLAGILAFAKQFGDSGGLVVGAFIAMVGWLGQRYFAFVTSKYEYYRKAIQFAQMYQKQIQSSLENYKIEFTAEKKLRTENEVRRKYLLKGKPAQLLASTTSKEMQDLIQKEAATLPISISAPIMDYYSSENLFDACYQLLGSPSFQAADLKARLKCVDDCYLESEQCIKYGEKYILDLGFEVEKYQNKVYVLLTATLVIGLFGIHFANKLIGLW